MRNTTAMGRGVQETRTLPVRELSPDECRALLVHAHETGAEMRRKAYLLKSAGSDWSVYFSDPAEVQAWIDNEPSRPCPLCKQPMFGGEHYHHSCPEKDNPHAHLRALADGSAHDPIGDIAIEIVDEQMQRPIPDNEDAQGILRALNKAPRTPGPWRVCDYTGECGFEPERYVIGPDAELVADCYASTQQDLNLPENYRANARLIAEAPAMLAELEKCLATFEATYPLIKDRPDFHPELRAIIARAKGQP